MYEALHLSVQRPVRGLPNIGSLDRPGQRLPLRTQPPPGGAQAARTSRRQARPRSLQDRRGGPAGGAGTSRRGPHNPTQRQSCPLHTARSPAPHALRECHESVAIFSHTIKVELLCLTEIENQIIKRDLRDGCPIASNLNDLKLLPFLSKNSRFADIRALPRKAW